MVFPEGGLNNGDLTVFVEIPYEKNGTVSADPTHDVSIYNDFL